jgi:hypothetical protein
VTELGEEGINDIVADDGTHIKKELMVGKVLAKGRDFANLKEGFTLAAHQLSLGDPNGVKLLHSKQDLDTLLDKIASWDTAQDVRAALDSYVAKVTARNLTTTRPSTRFCSLKTTSIPSSAMSTSCKARTVRSTPI